MAVDLLKRIEYLKTLPIGWDFGYGIGTLKDVADKAIEIYERIEKENSKDIQYDATPMTDGGIVLIVSKLGGDDFFNLTINVDLTIDYRHEKGVGWQYDVLGEVEDESYDFIIGNMKNFL